MFTTPTTTAPVSKAEDVRPAKPARYVELDRDEQVADLQNRAELYAATLTEEEVEEYEFERYFTREEHGLNPVPVTTRGLRILEAYGYTVDHDGYLRI